MALPALGLLSGAAGGGAAGGLGVNASSAASSGDAFSDSGGNTLGDFNVGGGALVDGQAVGIPADVVKLGLAVLGLVAVALVVKR